MILSPLLLEKYFFTKIHIDACPNSCEKAGKAVVNVTSTCMKHKDEERKWMVQLDVKQSKDKNDADPEYTFHIQIVGFYEVKKDYDPGKAEALVHANGPALLYSATRELIAMLTNRGPFTPVNLQTVSFIDEVKPNTILTPKETLPKKSN